MASCLQVLTTPRPTSTRHLNKDNLGSVAFEGVNLSHRYVVREMNLLFIEGDAVRHYFLNPPKIHFTPADKKTDGYSQSYLGGFGVRAEIPGALGAEHYKHISS